MQVKIDGDDLRTGLVSLVVALAEIVKETLKLQALRRLEALNDLDEAFERMKMDLGVGEAVSSVRDGLDQAVDDLVNSLVSAEAR